MSRLVVTGRQGQIASALREATEKANVPMTALGRSELNLSASPKTIKNTIIEACQDASVIVNAAAYTSVDAAENDPEIAMAINCEGAGAVAEGAREVGVPVIQLSTDYVFDGAKHSAWVESDPTNPLGVYGRSKLAGEKAVAAATIDHVILRTAWVYSPFGKNFVKTMLRLAEERDDLKIVSDQRGTPTSAFDIAGSILTVARNLRAEPDRRELYGTFHCAGCGETSWADFARAIFASARKRGHPSAEVIPIRTIDYPTPAVRPMNSALSARRLAELHEERPREWSTALEKVLDRLLA